jgi:hypothetical protein
MLNRLKYQKALFLLLSVLTTQPTLLLADGVSAVKACESDESPSEDMARLTILPDGESRGSDTAAKLIETARRKAREGKDAEAIQ